MSWPAPIASADRMPRAGQKVLGWCSATRQWLSASWRPGSGDWHARGYTYQAISWWLPLPPTPPNEEGR